MFPLVCCRSGFFMVGCVTGRCADGTGAAQTDIKEWTFHSLWMALASMIQAGLAGDFDFSAYHRMDATVGPILFLFMLLLTQIIMTNLLIAIISSEYDKAKIKGERMWKNDMAAFMANDLIRNLSVDSSGTIDMLSSAMLVGHDMRMTSASS